MATQACCRRHDDNLFLRFCNRIFVIPGSVSVLAAIGVKPIIGHIFRLQELIETCNEPILEILSIRERSTGQDVSELGTFKDCSG